MDFIWSVFKPLFKIPIIILIVYLVFNLLGFSYTYFKLLGASYVVMSTVVENNYIPPDEEGQITKYLNEVDGIDSTGVDTIELISNVRLTPDSEASVIGDNNRTQYGEVKVAGVQGRWNFIFPLMPTKDVAGMKDGTVFGDTGWASIEEDPVLAEKMRNRGDSDEFNIKIEYKVPGLRYYPDLEGSGISTP